MLLNYHIGRFVLELLCVGFRVRFGWGGIQAAKVVVLQHSRKLLKMSILVPETF
jgi:hypothetical protein